MKLGIHFVEDPIIRGPQKVVINLMMGLVKANIPFVLNSRGDFNICLQSTPGIMGFDPSTTMIGPNVNVIPPYDQEVSRLLSRYHNFLVPCDWVKKALLTFPEFLSKSIYTWPVGIDTDSLSAQKSTEENCCFIYFKSRPEEELRAVKSFLSNKGIRSDLISYGSYSEESLKSICRIRKFCVVLDNTESQGIALMEILSMNTPCYVIDHTVCDYNNWGKHKFQATSAPYFNNVCGMIGDLNFSGFDQFLSKLDSYNPRSYITQEHSLEISAKHLLNIVESIGK